MGTRSYSRGPVQIESRSIMDVGMVPGMPLHERRKAVEAGSRNLTTQAGYALDGCRGASSGRWTAAIGLGEA